MKIALVTTWGQDCGIATYSEELASEAPDGLEYYALGPEEARGNRPLPQVPERRCWTRGDASLATRLLPYVEGCDLVHVQHEFGLFPRAWAFLGAVREMQRHLPVVVTLHTAHPYGEAKWTAWIDALCCSVSAVVVHTSSALAAVACARHPPGFLLRQVPHGTRLVEAGDRERGRKLLRVDEGQSVGLALGFVGVGKNLLCTVRGFAEAKARRLLPSDAVFAIAGDGEPVYSSAVQGATVECGGELSFRYLPGFLAPTEVRHVMAAADYGVLNTSSWSLSASGAAHVLAGHGVPFACASRPIYEEAVAAGAVPFHIRSTTAEEPDISLVNAISALARPDVARQVQYRVQAWGQATQWAKIAETHRQIYAEVLRAYSEQR